MKNKKLKDKWTISIFSSSSPMLYIQVIKEIRSEKREYERLLQISDYYPKYVLRTDAFAGRNYEEICFFCNR